MKLELLEVTNDHAYLVCGPVACVIWRGAIDEAAVLGTERLGMRALENSPRGAAMLFYPESTQPSPELRELSATVNERLAARGAVGVAGVFLARGIVGTVQRGIATGMTMLSAHSYPMKFFTSSRRAGDWLGGQLRHAGVVTDMRAIVDQIDEFRSAYIARGAATSVPVGAT